MKFEYKIISSEQDMVSLEPMWKELEHGAEMTVFQSYDWNVLLVEQWMKFRYNRRFTKIYIFQVIEDDKVVLIAPMIVQRKSFGIKWLGRKKGIYFLGIESYSDYMNMIYDHVENSWFDFMLKKISEWFPQLDFKLDYVRDDTALAAWCKKKRVEDHLTTSAFVELPTTVEEYNAKLSKGTKQNLRTALNRMKKDGYVYELFVHKNIDDDEFINELSTIHAERARIKNRVHDQDLIHYFSRILHANYEELKNKTYDIIKNSMRRMKNSVLVVVKLNNETVGYLYGLRDDKAVRIMQNCFKVQYAFYSPLFRGAYDFILNQIKNPQNGIDQVDFTRGDEPYKIKLGGWQMPLHHYILKSYECKNGQKISIDCSTYL